MKNGVFWLSFVALVRTDVSEELSASFIMVTRIGELETTLVVSSNRRTQLYVASQGLILLAVNIISLLGCSASPTSGGRSVGIVRLRTKSHGICICFLGCSAMWFGSRPPTFQMTLLHPSSRLESKPSQK
jgi:hypothetical protein